MGKKILGLDLGTTSIGFAVVDEGEDYESSFIELAGVRVNPLTTDEQTNFEKGKPIAVNAERTLKRGMRRNLDRYQLRRSALIKLLRNSNIINDDTLLNESGNDSTFSTWRNRALAATEKISLADFAKVLLAINKKRGYKSSRKAKSTDEGQVIDSMSVARQLYDLNLTPGQLSYSLLKDGRKRLPDYYRSDLNAEFDKVWEYQKQFYPEIFTDDFKKLLSGKGQKATSAIFWSHYGFNIAENKGTREEKRLRAYKWRSKAFSDQLMKEEAAYVITDINGEINKSSGYLGEISDRSKELFFNRETIGQYLYKKIQNDPHTRLKGQVFYRQDYLDEFETIWQTQAIYYPQLTNELKAEMRDVVIFYQRKLKSQKGLISFCEFESQEKEMVQNGKTIRKKIGLRVAPRSSPLFQEFKIWQQLNHLEFRNKNSREKIAPLQEEKDLLFDELNIKGRLTVGDAFKILGYKPSEWEMNYKFLEGNKTSKELYDAFLKILEYEGYENNLIKSDKDDNIDVSVIEQPASEITKMVETVFNSLGIDTGILKFDAELDGKAFEKQPSYVLWHLLYSLEDDVKKHTQEDIATYGNSNVGLRKKLCEKFGFKPDHARILSEIVFLDDYASLSTKALRKIVPFIKELTYDKACAEAGYRHSAASLTKEEIENRVLKDRLPSIKKNELRNPVVEKILNQTVNVVNMLIDRENEKRRLAGNQQPFHFDEIRIELSRELKKNTAERKELSAAINSAELNHIKISKILQTEFGVPNPSRKDIIRYKLYEELKNNGYKDVYTNTYIPREILFSKQIDVDHIIPQMTLFDDSFSNKTLVFRKDNQEKGNQTAFDYLLNKNGEKGIEAYLNRITFLHEVNLKNREEGIGKAKFLKLQKRESEIGDGFIERDLRESQYIAKKAKDMLLHISKTVVSSSGSITARLREDWGLNNIMQELNYPRYKSVGLIESVLQKDGQIKENIVNWSKRDDHRHHAVDALVVAFTKPAYIQYLNHLSARNENHKLHGHIIGIEKKHTHIVYDSLGNRKRKFKEPLPGFRAVVKEQLEQLFVSHKVKNKVVTKNKNKIRIKQSEKVTTVLTPRGQLHKETVYGKYNFYQSKEEKVSAKFDKATIERITNPHYRKVLLQRLTENDNDPKKAFTGKNSLSKNPVYLDAEKTKILPELVKLVWLEEDYSIRKELNPDNFKDDKSIEKVLDEGVKRILKERLNEFNGDAKKAFSDLEKNPVWLNKEKGITIKRVAISGVKNAEPLGFKMDHFGKPLLDVNGELIPNNYIQPGSNHHVSIYADEKGVLQDRIVSFIDAVRLVTNGERVIDKQYNQGLGWKFLYTIKVNEMFVFPNDLSGFNPLEIDLLDPKNKSMISPNLFRVQSISLLRYGNNIIRDFKFRHHQESKLNDDKNLQGVAYRQVKSLKDLAGIVKVRIDHIGNIVSVGEY
jgi:CRISPR-associated endonuclease Csn1